MTRVDPPRALVWVAVAVLALTSVLVVVGALRTGIGTDEPIHVMRLRNLLDTGWYALDWDFGATGDTSGADGAPGGAGSNVFVYGPVAMLLLHAWGVLWGTDSWGQIGTSETAYQVRHLGVALIALAGVAATAALGRVLLRGWGWGLVAAAVLAALPVWSGNAMMNVKDVPVATGHTLVTLGLVLLLRADPASARLRWARGAVLTGGLVLALGTRPGMWPGLLVVVAVAVGGVVVLTNGRERLRGLGELGLSCLAASALLVASYPNLFGSPWRSLPRTTEGSSRLLEGADADRWYLVRHLATDVPTLLGLFAVAGAGCAVVALVASLRRRPAEGTDRVVVLRLALVAGQAVVLPLAAMALGSDLYHGLRQVLFVLPALAVLAAVGIAWALRTARPRHRLVLRVAGLTAAAALVLPVADQVTLQPYQSTYVNLASDVVSGWGGPADDRPGSDYWRVSLPELVGAAPEDRRLLCKAYETEDARPTGTVDTVAHPFTNADEQYSTRRSIDCREETDGPLDPSGLPVDRPLPLRSWDAVFIGPVPDNCTATRTVTRTRHGVDVVLSTLARCRTPLAPLGAAPVRADAPVIGTTEPGDLWLYAGDGWLQWPGRGVLRSPGTHAGLGFLSGPDCGPPSGCRLEITGRVPADLVARVDGRPVDVVRGAAGVRLPVTAADGDAVRVDLSRRSPGPLDVRLTGLALVPADTQSPPPTASRRGAPPR